ncbi:MAG TPA: glycosyltransferase, partial [Phycisphaerae bacterium]|nr:glycosyltransferase [Phycisphaerae bacterium]
MNILIAGHFSFPAGSAAASRVRHFAQGLAERGHAVRVVVMAPAEAQATDALEDGWADWRGVRYTQALGWAPLDIPSGRLGKITTYLALMRRGGVRACAVIDEVYARHGLDLVLGYSQYNLGLNTVMAHCAARRIPLVNDVVEFLGPDSFAGGRINPLYWDSMRGFRFLLPRSDGIIAISGFLERWFTDRGVPTLRIPAIIDPGPPPELPVDAAERDRPYTVTYLGNMIDRDGPMVMIDAVRRVAAEGHDVRFNVVGGTERIAAAQRAKATAEADALLRDRVVFWGRVSDEDVRR